MTDHHDHKRHAPSLTRRALFQGLGSAWTILGCGVASSLAVAAPTSTMRQTDKRLVVILLRGGMDGLDVVAPYGDSTLRLWRPDLAMAEPGAIGGLHDLGGFYGLHPSLAGLHDLYKSGEFLPVHATAGPYRSRSHFDAQDFMECGADHLTGSGWLNRALSVIPDLGRSPKAGEAAIAMSVEAPLLLRGPTPVGTWSPPVANRPGAELYSRIAALNAHDPVIGAAIQSGLHERRILEAALGDAPDRKNGFPVMTAMAGKLLAAADGPRIAALEFDEWDTHVNQKGRMAHALGVLDSGVMALKQALGDAWANTAVVMITEFGRTVRSNGTGGTDHGTGSVTLLAGGNIAGGKVLANWPGLSRGNLFQDRDLQPTTDVRSIFQALSTDHMGTSSDAMRHIFPGEQLASISDIIRKKG